MPRNAPARKKYRPPASRAQGVTMERALEIAFERHRAGNLDDAEPIYAAVLDAQPDHVDVLSHMGILKYQRGQHDAAFALLERATTLAPGLSKPWNNLGNVLVQLGRHEDAVAAFERSLALAESPEAHVSLARVWRLRGDHAASERACRRALELAPDAGLAWHHLSLALLEQGAVEEGFQASLKAMQRMSPSERRRDFYARALLLSGERERAAEIYRAWLAEEPDNEIARHHLAACLGRNTPARASDGYVEQVFDRFAESFDANLARLGYRGPELVAEALDAVLPPPAGRLVVADLGCGTGLCGPLLRAQARTLVGVDLSQAMLDKAAARGVYDTLHKDELVRFLDARRGAFDILACADTLLYFGDLRDAARAAGQALRPGGRLAFTLEAAAEGAPGGYVLGTSGRYAHAAAYVRRVMADAGLEVLSMADATLRREAGLPVRGWVVAAARPA
ncbi:MAG TPA: tetratricopeptide repeat protein [Burkholderiaceae bacterium]